MGWIERIGQWPSTEVNNLAPWYVVTWRLLWIVPAGAVLMIYCGLLGIIYGPSAARSAWRENI